MRYVKAVLVGLVVAVTAAAAWVFVALIVPVTLPLLVAGGTATANVGSGSVLAVGLVGFVAGVWWRLRKTARPTSA